MGGVSQTAPASMSAEIPENPTFLSGEFRYTSAIRLVGREAMLYSPVKGRSGADLN